MVNIIKKYVGAIFYVFLIIFLYFYLKKIDFSKLSDIHINWFYLLISSFFALGFRYWGAYIWMVLLKNLGAKNLNNKTQLIYIYAKSWLGRYIPGTAPWILGKIYFASKQGISKNKLAVSSLLEGALQVVVVMVIAFIMIIFDRRLDVLDSKYKYVLIATLIVLIFTMIPKVFNKLLSFAYKLLKGKNIDVAHLVSNKIVFIGSSMYVVGALLSGLSLFFIAKAVYIDLSYSDIFFVMGVGNLSTALSMLAIFAPSGLGVREGVQVLLLSVIMPTEYALVIAVVTRLWSIVIDLLFFAISKLSIKAA